MIQWRVVTNQIWRVSCTFKMGLCLQFALNHILNLPVHPAQNCIVLDLIWISRQFLVTFWGWLNKHVLKNNRCCQTVTLNHLAPYFFHCFNAHVFLCFFFCFSKKTHPSIEATVSDPQQKSNLVEFVLRSGHLSSSLMPVAIGAETAAVSSVGRIPRTNQEGNQSLRYAKKHVGYFLSTLLWRDFRSAQLLSSLPKPPASPRFP